MRSSHVHKYNPRQCTPEELEATFVARQAILESILDDLETRADAPVNQHVLIIGPRGIGKTNLLLMVRKRILETEALRAAYLPLQTAEEEYSIAGLRDLFEKIIRLVLDFGRELPWTDMEEPIPLAPERLPLEAVLGGMQAAGSDDEAAEIAIDAVRGFCERTDRKIVLLVDNLDLILGEQLRDDAQLGRLRDILMNESFLVLVGAAPTHFREVSGYDRPFYNFFRTIDLEDLSPDQMGELLRRRAEWDGNQVILARFDELEARIRAVHHLTGGNPRLVLMLYQLCTASELPEVRAAVNALLDDLTPYYKHRLEQLSAQQRRVMDTFARLGHPATPTELAEATRLPVNQVNSILKRLRETGFVAVAPQARRKTTLYMVTERVFRIWHQMRFATASRRLQFLIDFLRIWYSPQEWRQETDRMLDSYRGVASEGRFAEAERYLDHLGYLAEAAPEPSAAHAVRDQTVRAAIEAGDYDHAESLLRERRALAEREGNRDELAQAWYLTAYLRNEQGRAQEVIAALEEAVELRPDSHLALYNWGCALADLAHAKTGAERETLFREACAKFEAALSIKSDMHQALYNWGTALDALARTKTGAEQDALFREACAKFEAALRIKPDKREALNNWGAALAALARTKPGAEQDALFEAAQAKVRRALDVARAAADAEPAAFYAAHLVHLGLRRAAVAFDRADTGQGRAHFLDALELFTDAEQDLAVGELTAFMRAAATEDQAELCTELLDAMRERGMERELGLLEPFAKAVEYWQKGRDAEVLDRLNPEMREIVEQIIRGEGGDNQTRAAAGEEEEEEIEDEDDDEDEDD